MWIEKNEPFEWRDFFCILFVVNKGEPKGRTIDVKEVNQN